MKTSGNDYNFPDIFIPLSHWINFRKHKSRFSLSFTCYWVITGWQKMNIHGQYSLATINFKTLYAIYITSPVIFQSPHSGFPINTTKWTGRLILAHSLIIGFPYLTHCKVTKTIPYLIHVISDDFISGWIFSVYHLSALSGCRSLPSIIMMTSSNGNIFRVTGHLCGEFTGPRWIPRTKASDVELWCFLWSVSE